MSCKIKLQPFLSNFCCCSSVLIWFWKGAGRRWPFARVKSCAAERGGSGEGLGQELGLHCVGPGHFGDLLHLGWVGADSSPKGFRRSCDGNQMGRSMLMHLHRCWVVERMGWGMHSGAGFAPWALCAHVRVTWGCVCVWCLCLCLRMGSGGGNPAVHGGAGAEQRCWPRAEKALGEREKSEKSPLS